VSGQRKFVCGFYGARDGYEVPVALAEAGLLEVLLTDFYGRGGLLAKSGLARAVRENMSLPANKVRGSLSLTLARRLCGKVFSDPEQRNLWPDQWLSSRIARDAARRDAHILTYEPYAVARPSHGFPNGTKQVVFYYHPHVDTEDAVYREDEKQWPKFHQQSGLLASPWRRRTADAWKYADLVICASSFTKWSLVAAGMEERRIAVVPYGTAQPKAEVTSDGSLVAGGGGDRHEADGIRQEVGDRHEAMGMRQEAGERHEASGLRHTASGQRKGPLRLLFVGRNPLRKGLHHLLMAWNAAKKRPGDFLTIVCAAKPLEMQRLVEGRDDVRWLASVSGVELAQLYRESDALVVPSLCEGFGHVYLEAMGHGCAVVGTRNSALPDIGDEKQGVFTVEVGDVDGLARLISDASSDPSMFRNVTEAAKRRAGEFTWERFRQRLTTTIRENL
jgi:glycosyltransferase involved in cell wall biosynthesis